MVIFLVIGFIVLAITLSMLLSYELRHQLITLITQLPTRLQKKYQTVAETTHDMTVAISREKTQTHWYVQQWWILISGFLILFSIVLFTVTRPIDPIRVEADYLKHADPQIYTLLNGEVLIPPPEENKELIHAAIVEAIQIERKYRADHGLNEQRFELEALYPDSNPIDRKWNRMNSRYKQRLLMVFKIMKERYNYDLVLLEGYRSPERQNGLSRDSNTTHAKAFQSYHQFGLAADVAFKKGNKIIISERDPWAWKGYQLYGEVAESVGLTWGGRWKTIQDYGHTEYRMPHLNKTPEMAEKLTSE
ncbi:M15 family metallopeptidase [Acinetobacter apis]|uniref:Peptidoglycan L-alanyl-D-glutamate endopeptidase CwlK n=1 Tax=Acinetobacter apis TaxID=1229165 RepID=A0A217EHI3_9GAMM|nr:M15 family metallopeptidase [Acinetobacter apis]SNQ29961.1 peptidoglycan L-alanyl-D-glutamate endopeptidase CwlK [Acinetobacter apis]